MKLIGVIAVLVLLATSCQKEDIRPNMPSTTAPTLRSADTPATAAGDGDGTIDEAGPAITDPNDANRTNKNPKPRQ